MYRPLTDKKWLANLVDQAIAAHASSSAARVASDLPTSGQALDFASAARVLVLRSLRARLPQPAQLDRAEIFRGVILQHVLLLLDLRLLYPSSPDPARVRAELAGFLAGAAGEKALALSAVNDQPSREHDRSIERALVVTGKRLRARFFPPGDPLSGLPMNSGNVAIFRRHLARVAGGYCRSGRLEPEALDRHAHYAAAELAMLAEALSGLLQAAGRPGGRARWVRWRQMVRLGLRVAELREARKRVAAPRAPDEQALAAPEQVRAFLFEQLLLAQLRAHLPGDGAARFVEAFAQAARLDPQVVVAAQLEAAAQSGDRQPWFGGIEQDWGTATDQVVDRVSTAITENLGALMTELRETGELGALLGKAAAGQRLTSEEWRKVRGQLLDLAKAVPALAIFAAPGGALLLPLLVKLLPFNFLPSAWEKMGSSRTPALPAPPSLAASEGKPDGSSEPAKGTKPAA